MANTFLAALGLGVGKSLCEHDLADTALKIMAKAADANCEIVLPSDVVVSQKPSRRTARTGLRRSIRCRRT